MLTACFDASGKTPTMAGAKRVKATARDLPTMVVAGFASQAGIWTEFDQRWLAVLAKYSVPSFYAGDFARYKAPYDAGWAGKDNEQKRRDLQAELMDVIETSGLRKFGSVLSVADTQKARAVLGLQSDSTATPYVMCSRCCVDDLLTYAIRSGQNKTVTYVFEKGDEESNLRQHLSEHGFRDPEFAWGKPVEKRGISYDPFIGLQAAGWISWEYYQAFNRLGEWESPHDPAGRWALKIFEDHRRIPGGIKVLYASNPRKKLLAGALASIPNLQKAVADATARIEKAKKETDSK
jgi:hypothetical protein